MHGRVFYFLWRLVLPLAVAAAVWLPHFSHYQVDRSPVAPETLQPSKQAPASLVLDEIANMALGARLDIPDDRIIGLAEQVLAGFLPVPNSPDAPLSLQGYPRDYESGSPNFQLVMASLDVERVLLTAFEQTHDQRFLRLATSRILEFAAHEAGQKQDNGFLWNDHAVAGRISVLAKLWRLARERPDFPAMSSRAILSLVERSGRLLAKPGQFTVRTNHGVVQNLALLQIAAAFPALPESGSWRKLAVERLNVQLPFYVSQEGVVLEHSADYQWFGTELLAMAVRLSVLNGLVPEPSLVDAARNSRLVLGLMLRPDGTLPVIGNTSAGGRSPTPVIERGGTVPIRHLLPPHPSPETGSTLFPVAGYSIWWQVDESKKFSQTLIAWAKHDGHGHKHADEGSVLFWSDGVEWVTNTGYWPYGVRNEKEAYSWAGSNAPHQPGEEFSAPRAVQLLKTGEVSGAHFIEIERRNKDGAQFRRQVLQIDPRTLLVLDFAQGVPRGTETIWTLDPTLQLSPATIDTNFTSTPAPDGRYLTIRHATNTVTKLQIRHGSEHPFAGWVVVNGKPTPADALQIVDPSSNSANALLFTLASGAMEDAGTLAIEPGATPDKWRVSLTGKGEPKRISRNDTTIAIGNLSDSQSSAGPLLMPLLPAPDTAAQRVALKTAFETAVESYPPWRELSFYRWRLSYALGILALLIEAIWFAASKMGKITSKRGMLLAHVGVIAFWAAISVWIFFFYLP